MSWTFLGWCITGVYSESVGYEWLAYALAALRGIESHEVIQALYAARRWPRPASIGGMPVVTVWARTDAGRRLIVVVRHLDGFDWQILGAREMTPAEAEEFDRWEAR